MPVFPIKHKTFTEKKQAAFAACQVIKWILLKRYAVSACLTVVTRYLLRL